MIFLAGCETKQIGLMFKLLKIPHVFCTNAKVDDALFKEISQMYYKNLSEGRTYCEAYEELEK